MGCRCRDSFGLELGFQDLAFRVSGRKGRMFEVVHSVIRTWNGIPHAWDSEMKDGTQTLNPYLNPQDVR